MNNRVFNNPVSGFTICPRCKDSKPLCSFSNKSQSSTGKSSVCKTCENERKNNGEVDTPFTIRRRRVEEIEANRKDEFTLD